MVIDGWICRAAAIFEATAREPMCRESTLQLIVRLREQSELALSRKSQLTVKLMLIELKRPILANCLSSPRAGRPKALRAK